MNSHGENSSGSSLGNGVSPPSGEQKQQQTEDAPERQAARLEQDIEEIRDNLGGLVSELDHRRHRLNPLNLVTYHPLPVAIAGVVLIGAIWGGIAVHNARERDRNTLGARTRRLQLAMRRAIDKPDRVAKQEPNVGLRILTAAGTAAAAVVSRKLATRLIARAS